MKLKTVKTIIGLLIFLFFFFASLHLLKPVYKKVDGVLRSMQEKILVQLENSTDLSISYDSLSPSIFTGIRFTNIRVFDSDSREVILCIEKVVFRYSLFRLLKKDYENAFPLLVLSGIKGDLDSEKLKSVIEKIKESKSRGDVSSLDSDISVSIGSEEVIDTSDGKEEYSLISDEKKEKIKKLLSLVPSKIQVKNVNLSYRAKSTDANLYINKLNLEKNADGSIESKCDSGEVTAVFGKERRKGGVKFGFTGNIVRNFSGSSFVLTVNPSSSSDYTIYRNQFLVHYKEKTFFVRSMENDSSYVFQGQFDLSTTDFIASIECTGLTVSSVVKMSLKTDRMKQVASCPVNLSGSAAGNVKNKVLSWNGKGSFELPENVLKSKERIAFDAYGDRVNVHLKSFSIDGDRIAAFAKGSINIKDKTPSLALSLSRFVLPNSNVLSFDANFSSEGKDVLLVIPALRLGNSVFTPLIVKGTPGDGYAPFSISLKSPGKNGVSEAAVGANGTVRWKGTKSLDVNLSLANLFLDTVAESAVFFLKEKSASKVRKIIPRLKDYVTDDVISLSTDFKRVNFNVPSFGIKDCKIENRFVSASFKGSENSILLERLNATFGPAVVEATLDASLSDDKQIIFYSTLNLNDTPYEFSGMFEKGKWLNISGSYGIDIIASLENGVKGTANISSLPIPVSKYLLSMSASSDFEINSIDDYLVKIKEFDVEVLKGRLNRASKLSILGTVDPMGFIIDDLSFSDITSSCSGNGYVLWNRVNGILDSVNMSIHAGNEFTRESVIIEGGFSNPLHSKLTKDVLLKDCYFTFQSDIRKFPLMRFVPKQYKDDTFNGIITASGTAENPYVSVKLEDFSAQWGAKPIVINGYAELLEGNLYIPDIDFVWGNMRMVDVNADLDLSAFEGTASADFSMKVLGSRIVKMPLAVSVKNTNDSKERHSIIEKFVPNKFTVIVDSDVTGEGLINESIPVHGEIVREGKNIYFASSDYLGVKGHYFLEDGEIDVKVSDDKPIHGSAYGHMKKSNVNLDIKNVSGDLSPFHDLVSTEFFGVYKGLVSGQINISGMTSDPVLDGGILVRDLDMTLPLVLRDHITAKNLILTMERKKVEIPDTRILVGSGKADLSMKLNLDRWAVGSIDIFAKSVASDRVYVNMGVPMADIKGWGWLDGSMHFEDSVMDIKVAGSLEDSQINVITPIAGLSPVASLSKIGQKKEKVEEKMGLYESLMQTMNMTVTADITLEKRVDITINPLLQALVEPGTKVAFRLDSHSSTWSLKSDVKLRAGHISYLSRNFYIREGSVTLDESEKLFDPYISARAETREKDPEGILVKLILDAPRQRLSAFSAKVSSMPPRSEAEIMAMLGQVVTGDTTTAGGLFIAGLDYGIQIGVFRKFENALRDLLNFDIFSIRVNLLQNAMRYGISSSNPNNADNKVLGASRNPLGNFMDNTSVYIGKYFGDAIYADALLQFSYDEKLRKGYGIMDSGIIFHPEIGLELDAPFANIRWSFAPDLEPLRYGQVPSLVGGTSITFSWRIAF